METRSNLAETHSDMEGAFRRVLSHEVPGRYQRLMRRIGPVALSAVVFSSLVGSLAPKSEGAQADASPGSPISSISTSGGDVIINGQPTLIIGMWEPDTTANAKAGIENVGVNMIIGTDPAPGQPDDNIAANVEGLAWVMPMFSGLDSNYDGTPPPPTPNQAGVADQDEPDTYCDQPSDFAGQTNSGITYQNYSENIASMVPEQCTPQSYYPQYIANLGSEGVATLDFDVINEYSCGAQNLTVSSMYDYVATLRARVPVGMPIGTYIETGPIYADNCYNTPVTPTDIVNEMRLAVAAGATVLNPWLYTTASVPYGISSTNAAAFKGEVDQLQQYSSCLLAPQNGSFTSPQGDVIKIGERVINPGPSQTDCVIAVNGTSQELSWSGVLPDLTSKESVDVTSATDGSTLQAKNGALSFSLAPNSWQIYEYQPSQALATKDLPPKPKMATSIKKVPKKVARKTVRVVHKPTASVGFASMH